MIKLKYCLLFIILLFLFTTSCSIDSSKKDNIIKEYTQETNIFFCPEDNCTNKMLDYINNSNDSIYCALYSLKSERIIDLLKEKSKKEDVRVVVDDNNYNVLSNLSFVRKDTRYQLSHNKFCIFDDHIVWTGSFNPVKKECDNNNVVVMYSNKISSSFNDEFSELWDGIFGKGKRSKQNIFYLNNKRIGVYFCPEDFCADKLIKVIDSANKSIYFMAFSFTNDLIADVLIKKHNQGVDVKGVVEKRQVTKYSKYRKLLDNDISVMIDKNKCNMHHKVFIIDNSIVVTGSFNPTIAADTKNDENLIIIYDRGIAEEYTNEFVSLTNFTIVQ